MSLLNCLLFIPTPLFSDGHWQLRVLESKSTSTSAPLPCRVHLKDSSDQPILPEAFPSWRNHFVIPGSAQLPLPPGRYNYEIERGPEYTAATGSFKIENDGTNMTQVALSRIAHLAEERWWSGELHVHRPLKDIKLLMRAEDLHAAGVISWWNAANPWKDQDLPSPTIMQFDQTRFYDAMGGEDERGGGALLYFNLPEPLPIQSAQREHPSPMHYLQAADDYEDVHVDVEKPFWWDMPVWVASGLVDTIGLANNHMYRRGVLENEAWGRARDRERLPSPQGNGYWTQEIYYHLLNAGLRIPPSAGSASGVLPNPVGYNRVYVLLEESFSPAAWWEGLRRGRSFVSNGPLLRVAANGHPPGHVFSNHGGPALTINLQARLDSRDPIEAFEIIVNGKVAHRIPSQNRENPQELVPLRFDQSGWFLVRTIATVPTTFRFASTAPWYVEHGPVKARVSRASSKFFVDWVEERIGRLKELHEEAPPAQQADYISVLKEQEKALLFWQDKVREANAP